MRADVNPGLVANLCKVLIITVESRAELHEAVYEETLRVQIETILDLILKPEREQEERSSIWKNQRDTKGILWLLLAAGGKYLCDHCHAGG